MSMSNLDIIEAAEWLLARCDGAHAKDGMGYNGMDSAFVRSVFERGRNPSKRQLKAVRKVLQKYSGQLLEIDVNPAELSEVKIESVKKKSYPKPHNSYKQFKIRFGKHNGATLWDLMTRGNDHYDPQYVTWISREGKYDDIKSACKLALEGKPLKIKKHRVMLTLLDRKIVLRSQYNEDLVGLIKALPSQDRKWDKGVWSIHFSHLDQLMQSIESYDQFDLKVSQELLDHKDDYKITLTIFGALVRFDGITNGIKSEISDQMKYKVQGAEFTPAFKKGKWDGYDRLLNWRDETFPIGFLAKATAVLDSHNLSYEIIDNRPAVTHVDYNWTGFTLRGYQKDAVKSAKGVERGFLVLPTGAGKTEIGMKLIEELRLKTLILVHKKELLVQWHKRLKSSFDDMEIGVIGDGKFSEANITIAMIQTAHKNLPKNHYDCIIVDEGHHTPANTYYEVSEQIGARYRYCLSATPFREDGAEMKIWAMSGLPIDVVDVKYLVENGYLAKFEFDEVSMIPHEVPTDFNGRPIRQKWQEELEEICFDDENNRRILNKVYNYIDNGYKFYIDVRLIAHGEQLAEMIKNDGREAIFIYGKHSSKKRQAALERFRNEDLILISTLIKEGVDLPEMNGIALAGPAKSGIENIQKVGRALRIKPDGSNAVILDRRDHGRNTRKWYNYRHNIFSRYYKSLFNKNGN